MMPTKQVKKCDCGSQGTIMLFGSRPICRTCWDRWQELLERCRDQASPARRLGIGPAPARRGTYSTESGK